ncbi:MULTISPECIES: DUF1499 domain-containing protein [unclassified Sulfitobacter]|nr:MULTISPECIES: DUF1499 domain-containing protein [unclassified Sulfitobacter]
MIIWGVLFVVVAAMAYVRLTPVVPEEWHQQAYPSGMGAKLGAKSFVWREPVAGDEEARLRALAEVISATPRTQVVAGSVDAGQVTFVTRSQVFGFPDFTTIGIYQGLVEEGDIRYLEVYGRARFGRSDLGVNAKRIKGWRAAIE